MMSRRALLLPALPVLAGCAVAHGSTILGAAPRQATATPVKDARPGASHLVLHGVMYEKCPVAGCWFMLRDSTGTIKVDTKGAGFTVLNVPVNTTVTVEGHVTKASERTLAASGVRY